MNTIVVYKSKSGFVKKYAQWLGEELSADVLEGSEVDISILEKYDTIVYGGGLYAVGINGIKLITENLDKLKNKNIIVFTSGASPNREEIISEVRDNNFSKEQQELIGFYYLRGGFNYNSLNFIDKILMKLMKYKINKKKKKGLKLTGDERGMLAAYDTPVDFTRKENIKPIVDYIKSLNK